METPADGEFDAGTKDGALVLKDAFVGEEPVIWISYSEALAPAGSHWPDATVELPPSVSYTHLTLPTIYSV